MRTLWVSELVIVSAAADASGDAVKSLRLVLPPQPPVVVENIAGVSLARSRIAATPKVVRQGDARWRWSWRSKAASAARNSELRMGQMGRSASPAMTPGDCSTAWPISSARRAYGNDGFTPGFMARHFRSEDARAGNLLCNPFPQLLPGRSGGRGAAVYGRNICRYGGRTISWCHSALEGSMG